LICRGEKAVEVLAAQFEISVKLSIAHMKQLRLAQLVETRKEGKYVLYRLASTSVADLWVNLRAEVEERLVELKVALASIVEHGDELEGLDRAATLKKAKASDVLVLDVRPAEELASAHLPHASSLPMNDLKKSWTKSRKMYPWSPTAAARTA
jgi:DNA-binding transcriptional ArsR family regulator